MTKYTVEITQPAQLDLIGIYAYITDALKEPRTARRVYLSIKHEIMTLSDMPKRCQVISEQTYATSSHLAAQTAPTKRAAGISDQATHRNLGTGGPSMNNTMEYKGYIGSVEFSAEDTLFFGKVMGIRSLISYEGENAHDLVSDFHGAVDDYLAMCAAEGMEPEKAYKGSFNIRISPELHKKAVITATARQMSLNSFVESSIEQAILARN